MNEGKNSQLTDLRWLCPHCGSTLGIIDRATQTTLRLKVRERFYWIYNADEVATPCRRCGALCQIFNRKKQSA